MTDEVLVAIEASLRLAFEQDHDVPATIGLTLVAEVKRLQDQWDELVNERCDLRNANHGLMAEVERWKHTSHALSHEYEGREARPEEWADKP